MSVTVLRLGHRIFRDQRITAHCCLVARAFGADSFVYTGQKDGNLEKTVSSTAERWGGRFRIGYADDWKTVLKEWKGKMVHLTVYGIPVVKEIGTIRKQKNLLIIIGGEKVPSEIYQFADWNLSVTSQPHSEVAALAVFLDRYFEGRWPGTFKGAKLKIVPQERGKKVEKIK
ncbi:MAG: tRNA (cytidine(56)-2'-O)-methyltransferase [Candidatus Aenigmarchaeota archaeon]|nr:tRNA (cytidine(56)-2'-O)-methyltransferase [Candidatus Aenigmarchaeota archaeon]